MLVKPTLRISGFARLVSNGRGSDSPQPRQPQRRASCNESFSQRVVTQMVHSARAKIWSAIGLTLVLLVCTSGGCMRTPCSGLPGCGTCCLFPFHGCAHQQPAVSVVDPVCYGYHATCWCPWPEQCGGCPTVPVQPVAAPHSPTGEDEVSAVDSPQPAAPVTRPSPDGSSAGQELPPLPDSSAMDGVDEPAPPPETKGEQPPKNQGQPSKPPIREGATANTSESTLRFVSYLQAAVAAPSRPAESPGKLPGEDEPDQSDSPAGNPDSDPMSHQADEPKALAILEALSTSFSPPARPHPRAEGPSAPPGN
jgi:hypothetical protein